MKKILKNKFALVAIFLGGIAILLMFIIIVVNLVASMLISSAAGAYLQEQDQKKIASLNLDLDNFTISGSLKDGKYHLVLWDLVEALWEYYSIMFFKLYLLL